MLTRRKLLQCIDRLETTLAQEREKYVARIRELENTVEATHLVQQLKGENDLSDIPIRFVETPPCYLGERYHVVLCGKVWIPLTEGLKDFLGVFLAARIARPPESVNPLPNGQSEPSACQCYAKQKHHQENCLQTVSLPDETEEAHHASN
ncbi:Uncharacterised protein [Mobiluncus mulieris]|nr:Uncharacterised protein [Mobiluncus mulieris]